jgi:hypothetical protein
MHLLDAKAGATPFQKKTRGWFLAGQVLSNSKKNLNGGKSFALFD